jgi:hypothetical protein
MEDGAGLAVHRGPRLLDAPAKGLRDCLMPEAYPEQRRPSVGTSGDHFERYARSVWRPRSRRDQEAVGAARQRLGRADLAAAHHLHLGPEFAQVSDEVPGEAVVIVDDQDHGAA